MKIGILFQDPKKCKISWQKHPEIYNRTATRVLEMANALVETGYETTIFSSLEDFINRRTEVVDLVFPCIECCFDRNTNSFLSTLLQMNHIPFVGNDSYINTIVSDKYLFKNIAQSLGIRTPKSNLIYSYDFPTGASQLIHEINLPCILKYRYGSMSYHTTKITDFKRLEEQIVFMLEEKNGPILCEEYIEGHELSVPVIGTAPNEQILAVLEYTDSKKKPLEIYDTFWKGVNDYQVELNALNSQLPAVKEIIASVHKIYKYLGYHDYARFDFRLNNQGQPFLLEGNPLPALAYESAFDPMSYGKEISFGAILSKIVTSASERQGLATKDLLQSNYKEL